MAMPGYKPSQDSMAGRVLGHKVSSIIVGILHLVLSVSTFIHLASGDTAVKGKSGTTAISVLECLAAIAFCVLLLIGLFKKNKCFVKSYLIYSLVFLILCVIGFFVLVFDSSVSIGVSGFFYFLLGLMLYLLFFFVVHTYYMMTYCMPRPTANGV